MTIQPSQLPGVLAEIARLTSVEIAVALARSPLAGKRVRIPARPREGNPLVAVVGRQAAAVICHHLADWDGQIPTARAFLRWHDARSLKSAGMTTAQIAERLRLTERHVKQLLQGFDPGDAIHAVPLIAACPVCGSRASHRSTRRCIRIDERQLPLPLEEA